MTKILWIIYLTFQSKPDEQREAFDVEKMTEAEVVEYAKARYVNFRIERVAVQFTPVFSRLNGLEKRLW